MVEKKTADEIVREIRQRLDKDFPVFTKSNISVVQAGLMMSEIIDFVENLLNDNGYETTLEEDDE